MAENLKTSEYNDGTPIPNILSFDEWLSSLTGAYCWFENDAVTYSSPFGALYNWYAITNDNSLCPSGWHLPEINEWVQLASFLGGEEVAGGKMKEVGFSNWDSPNFGATNISGFTGLAGGARDGTWDLFGGYGCFWIYDKSVSKIARLNFADDNLNYITDNPKEYGFSVRCIKDWEGSSERADIPAITKLSDTFQKTIEMYPNPANTIIYFKNLPKNASVSIFDLNGRKIKSCIPAENQIDISDLTSGIYSVQITSDNKSFTKKLIKE
jgi:uncharacterized protein (TIGR02145 family)